MKYGYARVSTLDQDNAMQIAALKSARCDLIIEEKKSAVKQRPQLDRLLSQLQQGDQLIIYKLDRLARSLKHLLQIVEHLQKIGVTLKSLTEPVDASSAAGKLFLQMLGAFAEFERNLIRERSIAGQVEAMKKGRPIGRPFKLTLRERSELVELATSGIPHRAIGQAYGVHATTVSRLCREATGRIERRRGASFKILAEALQ